RQALAEDARQALRGADGAALRFRRAEADLGRRDDEVARAGDLDAGADRRAVYQRDARHRQRLECLVSGEGFQPPLADPLLALSLALLEIGAAAEHRTVAAHEDDAGIFVR